MTIRILQINAQRSLKVANELRKITEEKKIDILVLQEPYLYKRQVKGYSSMKDKIVQNYENQDSKAAIIIYNRNIVVTQLEQFKNEHIVCAHLKSEQGSFYIVSVYCQYSHDVDRYLKELELIISELGKNKL